MNMYRSNVKLSNCIMPQKEKLKKIKNFFLQIEQLSS